MESEPDIVSRDGLHWHPQIAIYVTGVEQQIQKTALSNVEPHGIHRLIMSLRHGADGRNEQGVIHLRFEGVVRKNDITLGQVLKKWGKDIHSYGSNLKMTVNGRENTEHENYVMRDRDKIELHYE